MELLERLEQVIPDAESWDAADPAEDSDADFQPQSAVFAQKRVQNRHTK